MIGVVDVGGGTRGIYGAGVFDRCMEEGIRFDYGIGVSAGSANIASYFAGQKGRNLQYYDEYAFRPEYMSFRNLVKNRSYIDFDYIYTELSNSGGEYPLDYEAIVRNPAKMVVVATDAETGAARYFTKEDFAQDDYEPFKASCCVPVIDRAYEINGRAYYDGGLADPIPYKKAFADGCDRLVIILTRPKDRLRYPGKDGKFALLLEKKYPETAKRLRLRYRRYNAQLRSIKELERQGRVLIVAPDDISGLKTLSKDHDSLEQLYIKGYTDAEAILDFI